MKKMLCSLLTVLLLVSCFAGTVNAAERAMGKFDVTVKAGELKPAKTGFPMAAGETVTINATYSPSSADVDFGLVDKNGRFHYLKGENGAFNEKIEIPQNGTYTFAIRNNSDVDIEVTGYLLRHGFSVRSKWKARTLHSHFALHTCRARLYALPCRFR